MDTRGLHEETPRARCVPRAHTYITAVVVVADSGGIIVVYGVHARIIPGIVLRHQSAKRILDRTTVG